MTNIEDLIRTKIDVPISESLDLYKDAEQRKKYASMIVETVNENVPKLDLVCNQDVINSINKTGYAVIENFLSDSEVDYIVNYISQFKGYHFHTPNRSFDQNPKKYDSNLDWNVCSYKMNHLIQNPDILKLVTRPDIISVAQEYLGCLPTLSNVVMWWSKANGESFHTQNIHRDYDDFKFLTLFIYMTDVTDENGPHVYFPGTHNGEENSENKVVITGKKGTAIFGDTFALHYGHPLIQGERLLFWTKYSLHKSNNFYRDKNQEFEQEPSVFFDVLDDNPVNRHILHAYTK